MDSLTPDRHGVNQVAPTSIAGRALALHRQAEANYDAEHQRERERLFELRELKLESRLVDILGEGVAVDLLEPVPDTDPDCEDNLSPRAGVEGLVIGLGMPNTGLDLTLYRPCPSCGEDQPAGGFDKLEQLGGLIACEPRECPRCQAQGEALITALVTDKAEPTNSKRVYLAKLGMSDLSDRARGILSKLSDTHGARHGTEERVNQATERVEMREASLQLTDEYSAGRNEAIRKAWLRLQRTQDVELAVAVEDRRQAEAELAAQDARTDHLGREWQLVLAEMRLASAHLQFLAGV